MRLACLTLIAMLAAGCADNASAPGFASFAQLSRSAGPAAGAHPDAEHALGWFHDGHLRASGPCAGGGWGDIDPYGRVLQVRADGNDQDATGTVRHPFATVGAAMAYAAAHDQGVHRIAVGPGVFPALIALGPKDPKVDLMGCSPDETTLRAVSSTASILDVNGSHHFDVKGVELSGGWRAVRVRNGGHLVLDDARVANSAQVGILVQDADSLARLTDTTVVDPAVVNDMGWGIAVVGATLDMTGGDVTGATGLGIFGDSATLDLTDVRVTGTEAFVEGALALGLGRGLHLQNGCSLTITGGLFQDNADASVFLLDPFHVVINGLVIDITSAGIVIDFPSTGLTGDGLVVSNGSDVQIQDSQVIDSARAGFLFDGGSVTVSGNDTTQNGLEISGYTQFAQDQAQAAGADAQDVLDLDGALLLDNGPVDWGNLLDSGN